MKTKKLIFSMFVIGVFILSFTVIPITMNAYAATSVAPTWKCCIYPVRHIYPNPTWKDQEYYEAIMVEIWTKDKTGKYIQGMSMYVGVMDFLAVKERRILIKENASGVPVLYPDANFLGIINNPVDKREIYIRAEYPLMPNGLITTKKEVTIRIEVRTAPGESGIERKYYTFKLGVDDYKKILIEYDRFITTINMIDMLQELATATSTSTSTATDTEPDTYMEFEDVTITDADADSETLTITDADADSETLGKDKLLDMDGDGRLDSSYSDKDHDGVLDFEDYDMDGDGKPNNVDSDMDGDGIENSKDTDDDGDGIPDTIDPWPVGFAPDFLASIRKDKDTYIWLMIR